MSNHILEPSFLHVIKTFDVIPKLKNYLFNLENGFFSLSWWRLMLVLDWPNNFIVKHWLNICLKVSLFQQELDVCVIVVIANNQAGFHQFIDKKLFLIKFFDHHF